MSDGLEELPPWGRARWFAAVLLLGLVHIGALFALSDLGPRKGSREAERFSVRLHTEPGAAAALLDAHALNDPTLLASVNLRGFSGPAWLNVEPPAFRLPEWHDEERWLTQDTAGLGLDFRNYVRTNRGTTLSVAFAPPPPETSPLGSRPGGDVTRVHVAGDLARRRMLELPRLESLPAPDLLRPTQVEVLVNREGFVFSPRLRHGLMITDASMAAAQRAADRRALELTREIRFEPRNFLPVGDEFPFTKGVLNFVCTTHAPISTKRTEP